MIILSGENPGLAFGPPLKSGYTDPGVKNAQPWRKLSSKIQFANIIKCVVVQWSITKTHFIGLDFPPMPTDEEYCTF